MVLSNNMHSLLVNDIKRRLDNIVVGEKAKAAEQLNTQLDGLMLQLQQGHDFSSTAAAPSFSRS